jgi:hypothetical protein
LHQEKQDNEWLIDDPEACLELLLELQALGDSIVIEHPEVKNSVCRTSLV